jgi:hypothetical protein
MQAATALMPSSIFTVLGQQDPILQELWAIKAKINKDSQFSVDIRCKQVQGLTWKVARARLGVAERSC